MKRIVTIGIAVFAAIAILGLASCNSDPEPTPTPGGGGSTDATLTSVKFGNETATLGTPGATWGAAQAGTVVVLQATNNITATPNDPKATIEYAVAKQGVLDEADFWSDTNLDFATGDYLAIKVTAEDKKTVKYYKIGVNLADVALATLNVGGNDVTLPNGGTTWQTAGSGGFVLFDYRESAQPAGGIDITATTASAGAEITYGKAVGDAEPTFSATAKYTFVDGDWLYVKVSKGAASAYYKVQINFVQVGTIKYGSPKIGYGADGSDIGVDGIGPAGTDGYIDPLWNDPDLTVYNIEKIYAADSGSYLDPSNSFPPTIATAKALWDEEGLSVYVKVIDGDVSLVDAEHETDSFELFVNEDITFQGTGQQKYSNGGSQYRVASAGKRSGEGSSPAAMGALNKTSAWHTTDGYIVIMKAPWRLRDKFYANNNYRNDWEFGFELQINCAPETGNRYAVLVWNNVAHTNYQNAGDYGIAKLVGGPATPNYPPLPPVITSSPQGGVYSTGDTVNLAVVTATPKDGGLLTYQWYSTADTTVAGDPISGATSSTYNLTVGATTAYYYAIVTSTLNNKTTTTRSGTAAIIIQSVALPDNWVDKVTMVNTSVPVYGFNLPAGKKFGDYTKVKLSMKMADASVSGRLRVWGNYNYAAWADVNANRPGIGNAAGDLLISSSDGGSTFTDVWTEYTREFNNFEAALNKDANATGVILLAIGPVPAAGGSGTKTYYVKSITLENADGSKVVKALKPDDLLLWGGNGASAYVTQNGADVVTRVLEDEEL